MHDAPPTGLAHRKFQPANSPRGRMFRDGAGEAARLSPYRHVRHLPGGVAAKNLGRNRNSAGAGELDRATGRHSPPPVLGRSRWAQSFVTALISFLSLFSTLCAAGTFPTRRGCRISKDRFAN